MTAQIEKLADHRTWRPELGEIVYLKSGSPKLTVVSVDGGDVGISWVTSTGCIQTSEFPAECLCSDPPPFVDYYAEVLAARQ